MHERSASEPGTLVPKMEPVRHDPLSVSTLGVRMSAQEREERARRAEALRAERTSSRGDDGRAPLTTSYHHTEMDDVRPARTQRVIELQTPRGQAGSGSRGAGARMGLWIDEVAEAARVPLPMPVVPPGAPAAEQELAGAMGEYRARAHKQLATLVRLVQAYEEPMRGDECVPARDIDVLFAGVDGLLRAAYRVVEQMRADDRALERVLVPLRPLLVDSFVQLAQLMAEGNQLIARAL